MKIASTQYTLQNKSFEIYLSGCSGNPKCNGCYNKELWDFDVGEEWSPKLYGSIEQKIHNFENLIDDIMVLGGEPLDQDILEFFWFTENIKSFNKKLWLFTRNELSGIEPKIANQFDYIKVGRYIPELKVDDNVWYGIKLSTSNQKILKKGLDY